MDNGITLPEYIRAMEAKTIDIRETYFKVIETLTQMEKYTEQMREEVDRIDLLRPMKKKGEPV
jgi:hypothetical protein